MKLNQRVAVMVAGAFVAFAFVYHETYRLSGDIRRSLLFAAIGLVAVGSLGAVAYWRVQRRISALAQAAAGSGFSFRPHDDEWSQPLVEFPFLSRSGSPHITNVIKGVKEGKEILLFDYAFAEGDSQRNQTAVAFRLREDTVPPFELQPERFWQSIFGGDDIDFRSHRGFSQRYFLRSPDEQRTRDLFQPRVLDALGGWPDSWVVQGDGAWLVMYRPRVVMRPTADDLRRFLDEAYTILSLFAKK